MLIDDEKHILSALQRSFHQQSWLIETYSDVNLALKRMRSASFDLFLCDYRMPIIDGVAFLMKAKELQPDAMRIMLSGQTDRKGLLSAINKAEIYRFIDKPWLDEDLLEAVKQALKYRDIMLENRLLADQVRERQKELIQHRQILEKYKLKHPELFKVNLSSDGAIILDEGN